MRITVLNSSPEIEISQYYFFIEHGSVMRILLLRILQWPRTQGIWCASYSVKVNTESVLASASLLPTLPLTSQSHCKSILPRKCTCNILTKQHLPSLKFKDDAVFMTYLLHLLEQVQKRKSWYSNLSGCTHIATASVFLINLNTLGSMLQGSTFFILDRILFWNRFVRTNFPTCQSIFWRHWAF
jgi:hypothetical protein